MYLPGGHTQQYRQDAAAFPRWKLASAIFEDQYPRIKKAHVILEYGKPFMVDDLDPEDKKHIGEYTANIIRETYERNKSLV